MFFFIKDAYIICCFVKNVHISQYFYLILNKNRRKVERLTDKILAISDFENPFLSRFWILRVFLVSFNFLEVAANGRPSFLPFARIFAKDDFVR